MIRSFRTCSSLPPFSQSLVERLEHLTPPPPQHTHTFFCCYYVTISVSFVRSDVVCWLSQGQSDSAGCNFGCAVSQVDTNSHCKPWFQLCSHSRQNRIPSPLSSPGTGTLSTPSRVHSHYTSSLIFPQGSIEYCVLILPYLSHISPNLT